MARIRSIKPEVRTSEVVAAWPREVRYAWVLLWGYMDDHGRGVDNPRLIASDLFPLDDDVDAAVMDAWLWLMATPGDHRSEAPLCRYEVDGRRFLHAVNWTEHQKPAHPTKSRITLTCPVHAGGEGGSVRRRESLVSESREYPERLTNRPSPQVSPDPEEFASDSREPHGIFAPEQGAGSREQGGGPVGTSPTREDLASPPEDDANPPAVPETRPAPLEAQHNDPGSAGPSPALVTHPAGKAGAVEQLPAEPADEDADRAAYEAEVAGARQRIGLEPPEHSAAMPPDRCPVHRELAVAPPCGRCARWREAQQRWKTERDATIERARAEVKAEMDEQRRLERQAIADCHRCDDRGILPSAVVCTHQGAADAATPGRAAFLAARDQLRQRAEARAQAQPEEPAATGEQLRLIAIRFGERGVNDRDTRLQVAGEVVGRTITTTRELTRAEAGLILDRFDHPLPVEPPVDDEPAADPRWTDPGWERVPLDDGGPDDPGTFVPRLDPDDVDEGPDRAIGPDHPHYVDAEIVEDELPPNVTDDDYVADDEPPAYVYAGGPDEPPF